MSDRKDHRPQVPDASRGRASGGAVKGTIAIYFVRAVVAAVGARGLDAAPLLREAGILPGLLDAPQSRVSAGQYSALWRLVIRQLDDEFFGQDSRRMKAGSFALLCRSVVHCSTLRSSLDRAARFFNVLLDDVSIELGEHDGRACLTLHQHPPERAPAVFGHETLLVMVHGLACWLVGRRLPIVRAAFAFAEPAQSAEYPALFGRVLTFAEPRTLLEFESRFLDLPVVQNERTAKEFLRVAPENILVKYKNIQSLAARIRRRLRQALPDGLPELDSLARELNTAPATLRRRLKAEGQSYQAIKDDLRRDLAIGYLTSSQKSVAEIAHQLGFLDTSAFHRAFRKWTRSSPGAYRRGAVSSIGSRLAPAGDTEAR